MKFNYCPQCGKNKTVEKEGLSKYVCQNCGWEFWNNPKAAAVVIFVNDKGELLFAERAIEPDKGKYDFTGGFLDYGEDPLDGAVREVREETGATIKPRDLTFLAAYTLGYIPGVTVVDIIMITELWDGKMTAMDDVAALEWKPQSFIHDPNFRPDYPGLDEKIKAYLSA